MHVRDDDRIHPDEETLTLHGLGADDGPERARVRRHLAVCADCREQLEEIRATLALVAAAPAPPAPDGFERVMWARVSARLQPALRPPGWRAWFSLPRLALAGGAVALVLVAFVAGRWSQPSREQAPAELLATLSPEMVIRMATEDHLERAQMVLAEVLHAEADDAALDAERTRAADLIAANRLIRQSMPGSPEAASDVLDDLERVLVEFVNRGDGWSPEELASFKARLDAADILFRLRVVSAELRQRSARPAPPVT